VANKNYARYDKKSLPLNALSKEEDL